MGKNRGHGVAVVSIYCDIVSRRGAQRAGVVKHAYVRECSQEAQKKFAGLKCSTKQEESPAVNDVRPCRG